MPRRKATPTDLITAICRVGETDIDGYYTKIAKVTAKCMALRANYIPSAAYDATTNPVVTIVIKGTTISDPHSNLPYYDTSTFNVKGRLITPPAGVRLSDRVAYHVVATIGRKTRFKLSPKDFDSDSNFPPSRVPCGPPVVVWANEVPYCPVYRGYYALIGNAAYGTWIVAPKPASRDMPHHFFIGLGIHAQSTLTTASSLPHVIT